MHTNRSILVAVVVGLAALAAACGSQADSAQQAKPPAEQTIRISGSGTALPLVRKLGEVYVAKYPGAKLGFDTGTNSGGAIRGVLAGTLDIAVSNRPLSAAEAAEPLEYHPFADDAQVFAVHLPNPASGLTTTQIRGIYAGRLTDWREVGGPGAPIVVLDRDEDESARKLVLLPLMDGQPVNARTVVLTRAADMVRALENTPNSLGYTSLGLLRIFQAANVKVLALDGVVPSPESLSQGEYPWKLTFGLVHRKDAPPEVRRFVDFVLGPQGLRILQQYGYAGVTY